MADNSNSTVVGLLSAAAAAHCAHRLLYRFTPRQATEKQAEGADPATGTLFYKSLISASQNVNDASWELSSTEVAGLEGLKTPWRVVKKRLAGGMQQGVDVIVLDTGALKMTVVPTRGMNVARVESGGIRLGWDSPCKELVHPHFVDLEEAGGLGWLYSFNEWMSRCGLSWTGHPGKDDSSKPAPGRQLSLHGRLSHIPASEVTLRVDTAGVIYLRGKVHERSFKGCNLELHSEVALAPDSSSFAFTDVVTNHGSSPEELQLLYHANFGAPLLEKGSRVLGTVGKVLPFDDVAAKDIANWDQYKGPGTDAPGGERLYCIEAFSDGAGDCHFALHNAAADKGVYCKYPLKELPHFGLWKNEDTLENGCVTGLEPGTSYAHNRATERKYKRVPELGPKESRTFHLTYEVLAGAAAVKGAVVRVETAKAGREATLQKTVIDK